MERSSHNEKEKLGAGQGDLAGKSAHSFREGITSGKRGLCNITQKEGAGPIRLFWHSVTCRNGFILSTGLPLFLPHQDVDAFPVVPPPPPEPNAPSINFLAHIVTLSQKPEKVSLGLTSM